MDFRWNEWNLDHATCPGVTIEEAEAVASNAQPPFPEYRGDDKWGVWGRSAEGRFVQVVYLVDPDGKSYIIHARPLTDTEKRRYRRRTK